MKNHLPSFGFVGALNLASLALASETELVHRHTFVYAIVVLLWWGGFSPTCQICLACGPGLAFTVQAYLLRYPQSA